jgi:hypothetical protein
MKYAIRCCITLSSARLWLWSQRKVRTYTIRKIMDEALIGIEQGSPTHDAMYRKAMSSGVDRSLVCKSHVVFIEGGRICSPAAI